MELKEAIIQGLLKEPKNSSVTESFRDTCLELNSRVENLASELLKAYGKLTNNYGCFDKDTQTYSFPERLTEYLENQIDLVSFSKTTCRMIASRMSTSHLSSGGYVCFLHYTSQGRSWILVVMLKLKPGTGIDPETLELVESLAFDINHLHEAARIDLEKWQGNEEPYLSFIKGSKSNDAVTQYFRLALGCTDYTDSKSHTVQALKAINDYCESNEIVSEKRQEIRRKAYDYFVEKNKSGEPVNLTALSSLVNDQEPSSFAEFVSEKKYSISETFEPHPRTYAVLKRITGKFGNVSVAFDVQDVIDGNVDYDDEHSMLIIKHPSSVLIEKISQAKGNAPI